MNHRIPQKVQALRSALLENPGHTSPELRRSVEANAASLGGRPGPTVAIPDALSSFIKKVACHAYKITDEEVADLLRAGYTEDELFEITLSAAFGASLARMEQGLRALHGES